MEIELVLSGALEGGKDGKDVEVGHSVDFVFPAVERVEAFLWLTLAPDPFLAYI